MTTGLGNQDIRCEPLVRPARILEPVRVMISPAMNDDVIVRRHGR